MSTVTELDALEVNNIDFFSFNNQMYLAKVIHCYDGDTIHCVFKLFDKYYKFIIRMYGYDSPEIKPSKELENRKQIKQDALKAKLRLEELILNKCVYLYCKDFDKYGRILGVIKLNIDDTVTINDIMIKEKHGYEYYGGKWN